MQSQSQHFFISSVAQEMAAQLGETEWHVLPVIERIIAYLGQPETEALVAEAIAIEQGEGMLVQDGSRRRTLGGVFFYLVRGKMPAEVWWQEIQRREKWPAKRQRRMIEPYAYHQRSEDVQAASQAPGEGNVKITIVGIPGKVIDRGDIVLLAIASKPPPPLPRGLPALSDPPPVYLCYIAKKQWRKVVDKGKIVIEGYPFHDKQFNVIGVLAQRVTLAQSVVVVENHKKGDD